MLAVVTLGSEPITGDEEPMNWSPDRPALSTVYGGYRTWAQTRVAHHALDLDNEVPHLSAALRVLKAEGVVHAVRLGPYNECFWCEVSREVGRERIGATVWASSPSECHRSDGER